MQPAAGDESDDEFSEWSNDYMGSKYASSAGSANEPTQQPAEEPAEESAEDSNNPNPPPAPAVRAPKPIDLNSALGNLDISALGVPVSGIRAPTKRPRPPNALGNEKDVKIKPHKEPTRRSDRIADYEREKERHAQWRRDRDLPELFGPGGRKGKEAKGAAQGNTIQFQIPKKPISRRRKYAETEEIYGADDDDITDKSKKPVASEKGRPKRGRRDFEEEEDVDEDSNEKISQKSDTSEQRRPKRRKQGSPKKKYGGGDKAK
jgi:hypothetical protein